MGINSIGIIFFIKLFLQLLKYILLFRFSFLKSFFFFNLHHQAGTE